MNGGGGGTPTRDSFLPSASSETPFALQWELCSKMSPKTHPERKQLNGRARTSVYL